MAENSAIEWTDNTFNPFIGCSKVSSGCLHCYAETLMDKRWGKVQWGDGGTRVKTSASNWKLPLKWNRAAEKAGIPAKVFCASLADVFEDRPEVEPWRQELWDLIRATPWLRWQLLTKRPENIARMLPVVPANVWLGTSVENTKTGVARIPHLLNNDATVRFLSCEPLLSQTWLNFDALFDKATWLTNEPGPNNAPASGTLIQWVIVGAESGDKARPMNPEWARGIVDQCRHWKVPVFVKQLCDSHGRKIPMDQWPEDLRVREWPRVTIPLDDPTTSTRRRAARKIEESDGE